MLPYHGWQVSPGTLAPEMAEGTSYICVRAHWQWRSSGVAQPATTKHQVVYLEPPVVAEPLMCPSVIRDWYVSAEMSPEQICTDVDIQITSQTDLPRWKPTLGDFMWWVFSGVCICFLWSFPGVSPGGPGEGPNSGATSDFRQDPFLLLLNLWSSRLSGDNTLSPCMCTHTHKKKKVNRHL